MQMWVTEIRLENYRAFADEEAVKIPDGYHLLVYGENGSGKSSLFRGFRDYLFRITPGNFLDFTEHNFETEVKKGKLFLKTSNNSYTWQSDEDPEFDSSLQSLGRLSRFFTYKDLLLLHQPPELDERLAQKRLFHFITQILLRDFDVINVVSRSGNEKFSKLYNSIVNVLSDDQVFQSHLAIQDKNEEWQEGEEGLEKDFTSKHDTYLQYLEQLQGLYEDLISKIVQKANAYLDSYFKDKIQIGILPGSLRIERNEFEVWNEDDNASFVIRYAKNNVPNYSRDLNEARLTSFALCFMLAATKLVPAGKEDSRMIFLDDIFTGLDMNNRLPLLKLIKSEFMEAEIAAFQVGIATHDRNWYELAKYWFDQRDVKVKYVEMYTERSKEQLKPDKPIVITEDLTYYDKAVAYFRAKDYPSTANLLRKESENLIRKILPSNKRRKVDEKSGKTKQDTSLESLLIKLSRYLESAGFDINPISPFETYKKIVLNPLSHDDLNAPHYRSELEQTFNMVDFLKSIFVREVEFSKDKPIGEASLDFGYVDKEHNNRVVKHQIFPRQTLRYIKLPNQNGRFMPCECRLVIANIETKCDSLNEAISKICDFEGYTTPASFEEVYKHFKVSGSLRLSDFII